MDTALPLAAAGRVVPDAVDNVRRYAGLDWSGGPPEVWAFAYYDMVPTEHDDVVTRIDVLAASVLHPGLSRAELAFFVEQASDLSAWLATVDPDQRLWDGDAQTLQQLDDLVGFADQVPLTLLTKVLHRKRPGLIPLLDRHVVDWYRPVTGERRPIAAWPKLIRAIRNDLGTPEQRLIVAVANGSALKGFDGEVEMSMLRFVDIAIWMASR
jgi:hypothetical protein